MLLKMALSVVTNDDHHFTLSNIPFGIVSIESDPKRKRIATRLLGDVFPIEDLIEHDLLKGLDDVTREALQQVSTTSNLTINVHWTSHDNDDCGHAAKSQRFCRITENSPQTCATVIARTSDKHG